MSKEDYFKYYIQGSDHYLIPKDIFDELFNEMENWKKEAKELKKRLEERHKEYVFIGNAQNKTRDFINEIIRANNEDIVNEVDTILSKYKEIIGGKDE